MPGVRLPAMINGIPVVTAPAEIDIITAGHLRTVLLHAAAHRHATIVVDMTGTTFCDSTGFGVLVRAHRQALAKGGGLRLVIPSDSGVARIFALIGLDRVIPGSPAVSCTWLSSHQSSLPAKICSASSRETRRSQL